MSGAGQRIVWLYYGDHRELPFIAIAADSLVRAGAEVTVVDLATVRVDAPYQHRPSAGPVTRTSGGAPRWALGVLGALASMRRHALEARPTAVIITRPQVIALGWLVAVSARARAIYYPFELLGEQHDRGRSTLARLERLFLRRGVDTLITQNAERADVYTRARGARARPAIVHNYKPYRAVKRSGRLRGMLGIPESARVVLYEGYLMPGRWLEHLVEAMRLVETGRHLVLMGEATGWWTRTVAPRLLDPDLKGVVHQAPWVPHDELLALVADADVGVIIYDDQVLNNYYCEPGKLSDYVLAGVPVIAPDFPTIGARIREHGVGETFARGEPRAIADAIERVLSRPAEEWRPVLAQASRRLVWETQEPALLRAVLGDA